MSELSITQKSIIFWDITQYSPLKVNRRFGETYLLRLHGRKISGARNQRENRWQAEILLFITTAERTSDPA
jgi:hypothetical protein